jgi:hypothetical protein
MLKTKMLSIDFISWSWKVEKKLFSREEKIFFSRDANSIKRIACSNRDKQKDFYLFWLASVNVFEEWCQCIRRMMLLYQWVMSVYHYLN